MKIKFKLFDIYILLITFFKGLGATADNKMYILVFLVGCVAIAMKLIQESFTLRELLYMGSILAIGVMTYVVGKEDAVLFTGIALCGLKGVNAERIIRLSFWSCFVAFSIMILSTTLGIVENQVELFWRTDGFIDRYFFGYDHPNTAHLIFAILSIQALYLYGRQFKPVLYVLILFTNGMLYQYTYSRTGMIMVVISVAFAVLLCFKYTKRAFMFVFQRVHLIILGVCIALGLLYARIPAMQYLDTLVSGRLQYFYKILQQAPPILGVKEYASINIDNGYLALLYHGGLLAFCWFGFFILKSTRRLVREKRYWDFFLVVCFALFSLTESFLYSISLNISLIFIGEELFRRRISHVTADDIHTDIQQGGTP